MSPVVCFTTAGGRYAVDVRHARRVLALAPLRALPEAAPGIAGLLDTDSGPLPVLSVLGPGARRVLEIETGGRRFGLLADEVTGVVAEADAPVEAAPPGHGSALVSAQIGGRGEGALLVDVEVLGRRLAEAGA